MLDLPPMQTRQQVEQFKVYHSVLMNKKQTKNKNKIHETNKIVQAYFTHEAAKDKKGRADWDGATGASCMGQTE